MIDATENPRFQQFMKLVDKQREMGVRTNADTPEDAKIAREFGAEASACSAPSTCSTGRQRRRAVPTAEDHPLHRHRRAETRPSRLPLRQEGHQGHAGSDGRCPVTIPLLDPLHEFIPQHADGQAALAKAPGHHGRRGQGPRRGPPRSQPDDGTPRRPPGDHLSQALRDADPRHLEAAAELKKDGKNPQPEIMVPVTCTVKELDVTKVIFDRVKAEVEKATGVTVDCLYGTMIEIPRAALLADKMAATAQFFSFGTNDLTQMGFGFSRDDIGGFLGEYLDQNILAADPVPDDRPGRHRAVDRDRRRTRPQDQPQAEGRHLRRAGRRPGQRAVCFANKLNYVSCSPYRVPIARLAAAQASIQAKKK